VKSRTITKLTACGHEVKVTDWGPASPFVQRIDLLLDGFSIVVVDREKKQLVLAMAEKIAFALRASERKKRRATVRSS
jgi:hypothetical protein